MNTFEVTRWLGDFYLLATLLLGAGLLACLFAGQPARRIALAWATSGGLGLLAVLCALPSWSTWHLRSLAPSLETRTLIMNMPKDQITDLSTPQVLNLSAQNLSGTISEVQPIEIDWAAVSIYLFLIGSAIVIFWLALGAWQVRRLRRVGVVAPEMIQILLTELTPAGRPIPSVRVLSKLPVAVAAGLINPAILLPRSLVEQARTDQIRSVLAHELAHLQHRDLWLMAGLRLLMMLLWAHPLFWLWRRRVRLDQEVLADTAAAELTSRSVYAEELVELARYASTNRVPRLASSVGLWETRSQLKRRLALLLDEKLTILRSCSRQWWVGSLVVLLGLAGGLSLVTLSPAELQSEVESPSEIKQNGNESPILIEPVPGIPPRVTDETQIDGEETSAISRTLRTIYKQLFASRQPNTIVGMCVDESGKPIANVSIEVYRARLGDSKKDPQRIMSSTSDSMGRFRFEKVIDVSTEFPDGLPDERFIPPNSTILNVVGHHADYVPRTEHDFAFRFVKEGKICLFQMLSPQTLRGRVVDEDNQPIEGARVSVSSDAIGLPKGFNSTLTDADGEFYLQNLERYDSNLIRPRSGRTPEGDEVFAVGDNGRLRAKYLLVNHPDFASTGVAIEKIPGHVDVKLHPGAGLTGLVVTQETGKLPEPAKNVEVYLLRDTHYEGQRLRLQKASARTDDQGRYRFDSLPPGKYSCSAETADWVTQGINGIELSRGKTTEAPDLVMTRGGRVRIQLIDDATGEPITFEKPTNGYVVPQPRPKDESFHITSSTTMVEFSPKGIAEQQLPAWNYLFHASVPGSEGQPSWQATTFASVRSQRDWNVLTTHEVKEGEVLELKIRMQREQDQVINGTLLLSTQPSDADEEDEPQKSIDFTPETPPADDEDKEAYENGIFVPNVPLRR